MSVLIIGAGDEAKLVIEMLKLRGTKIAGIIDILNKYENLGRQILGC